MTKTFVEFLYPGSFFSESKIEEVSSRNQVSIPEGSYGYRFFDQTHQEVDGEVLIGKKKNYSGVTYKGDVYTLDKIKKKFGDDEKYHILISNCEINNWNRVVRTCRGNWQPLEENDVVM